MYTCVSWAMCLHVGVRVRVCVANDYFSFFISAGFVDREDVSNELQPDRLLVLLFLLLPILVFLFNFNAVDYDLNEYLDFSWIILLIKW